MKVFRALIVFSLLFVLASCSGVSVSQDYDPDFDFSTFKTFAVAPFDSKMGLDQITYGEFKSAITKNLTAKGMTESDNNPDFVVTVATAKQRQTEIDQMGMGWGAVDVYQYEEGTIMVDVVDSKTQKLAWRSTAQGELSDNPSQEEKLENINSVVAKMLGPFPPTSR